MSYFLYAYLLMASDETKLLKGIQETDALSPKSKSSYTELVNAIQKRAEAPIEEVIVNPNKYIPLFKKWYTKETTLKSQFSTILTLFKYNRDYKEKQIKIYNTWLDAFTEAKAVVDTRYETNKPTERQTKGYVPYEDIIKARDALPSGHMHKVLLDMYTYLRPMRCEYARVAIYKNRAPPQDKREPNYILINRTGGRLIINFFKTRKHHDAYDIKLPKELYEDIIKSLEETPRDWLFVNSNDEPYTSNLYTKWTMRVFQSIFKRPLTVALIRHAFINTIDFNTLSIKDKKDIATSMGHTIETQDRYRLLFDDKKSSCDCVCTVKESNTTTT